MRGASARKRFGEFHSSTALPEGLQESLELEAELLAGRALAVHDTQDVHPAQDRVQIVEQSPRGALIDAARAESLARELERLFPAIGLER